MKPTTGTRRAAILAANRRSSVPPMSEAQFQAAVIQLATAFGWKAYHVPDSRRVTERGFPDLTMINEKQCRLLFAELKSATGRLTSEQKLWLRVLDSAGVETAVWRPADLTGEIPRRLRPGRRQLYPGTTGR